MFHRLRNGRDSPVSRKALRGRFRALRGEALESRALLTATAQLLADLNSMPLGASVDGAVVSVGNEVYFFGGDSAATKGLWRSDGTTEGTALVKQLEAWQGPPNVIRIGGPQPYMSEVRGTLFFAANDGTGDGVELWRSDGTPEGTVRVRDIQPGGGSSTPHSFVNISGTLFFIADDGTHGDELWKTDGTAEGTALVRNIAPGQTEPWLGEFTNVQGTLFFAADDGVHGRELWKSDGTLAGTVLVKDTRQDAGVYSRIENLTALGPQLFFSTRDSVHGRQLWKSDGTPEGTVVVRSGFGDLHSFSQVGGTLYFRENGGFSHPHFFESLWRSDGSANGTQRVKEFVRERDGYIPEGMIAFQGALFLVANDGTSGWELWKSDGTASGTRPVYEINPTGNAFDVYQNPQFTVFSEKLYFFANDSVHGRELWETDGTGVASSDPLRIGTRLVKNTIAGSQFEAPGNLAVAGDTLFYSMEGERDGRQLWKSDGTEVGAAIVPRADGRTGSAKFALFGTSGNNLYFTASTDGSEFGLWKTDGTKAGTVKLKGGLRAAPTEDQRLVDGNGTLFFVANDGVHGVELWRSDGTTAGTVIVKDIRPGGASAGIGELTNVGGILFFRANDGTNGFELWKSDGSEDGTRLVKDLTGDTRDFWPQQIASVNGEAYFGSQWGNGLWKSDGTSEGTVLVSNLAIDENTSFGNIPLYLTNVNGTIFFTANAGGSFGNRELWKSDGTAAGTVLVKDLFPGNEGSHPRNLMNVNGKLLFVGPARFSNSSHEIWTSDGTADGTFMVKEFGCCVGSDPRYLTDVGVTLFYRGNTGISGYDLYRSDGTAEGTVKVQDIEGAICSCGSNPEYLVNVAGTLYFTHGATDAESVWQSNGTAAGTLPVRGPDFRSVSHLATLNGQLIFAGDDRFFGNELWTVVDINAPPSFLAGVDVVVKANRGPQAIANWAKSIVAGPADESDQDVTFRLEIERPELFADGPTIDASGRLAFTPAEGASGTTVVNVVLLDDGGTAQGGVDWSAEATFSITIRPPSTQHNIVRPLDVTGEGAMTSMDALAVVNWLNAYGAGPVDSGPGWDGKFYDVNDDDFVGARDALDVINYLNAFGPTGADGVTGGAGEMSAAEGEASTHPNAGGVEAVFNGGAMEFLALLELDGAAGRRRR